MMIELQINNMIFFYIVSFVRFPKLACRPPGSIPLDHAPYSTFVFSSWFHVQNCPELASGLLWSPVCILGVSWVTLGALWVLPGCLWCLLAFLGAFWTPPRFLGASSTPSGFPGCLLGLQMIRWLYDVMIC